jgi:predicted O-linked N-acetylglucosamine transferase (SPINDLY family)
MMRTRSLVCRHAMGLLGLRPAPIQVSWKNFVGSLGADGYVGHLVGDAIVTPPELQGYYSERLFLLPVIHRFCPPFFFSLAEPEISEVLATIGMGH